MITTTQASQYLDSALGVSVPSFVVDAAVALVATAEAAMVTAGYSAATQTLVQLYAVAILAAIAIPKFANTKEKAYFAKMKGDLRNLATAQEAYAADNNGLYAFGSVTAPAALTGLSYGPSSGVTIEVTAGANRWEAVASMPAQTPNKCGMFINNDDPPTPPGGGNPATNNGEPKCAN